VLDIYPHPTIQEFETYLNALNPRTSRVSLFYQGVDFGAINDIIVTQETIKNMQGKSFIDFDRCIKLKEEFYKYEQDRGKHVHKGALFFNIGLGFQEKLYYEMSHLYNHRAFIEDDFKHHGTDNFPAGHAYSIITLDRGFQNTLIFKVANFIESQFLRVYDFTYNHLQENFLNRALFLPQNKEPHKWLDHIASFTNLFVRIEHFWHLKSDILSSIIGQIKVAGLIGDFCLLIESFCKQKLEKTGT